MRPAPPPRRKHRSPRRTATSATCGRSSLTWPSPSAPRGRPPPRGTRPTAPWPPPRRHAASARTELEEARRAHVVAGLRPHLVAGQPCPVCEQTVATLPAPLPAHEVDAAQARLAEADRAVTAAQSAARKAAAAAAKAEADLAASTARAGSARHRPG